MRLFNKDSFLAFDSKEGKILKGLEGNLYSKIKPILNWVLDYEMTEKEKNDNPTYKTCGGYLKKSDKIDYSAWNNDQDIAFFKSLPNFCPIIFKEITGIDLCAEIEVTINGVVKKIKKEDAEKLGLI